MLITRGRYETIGDSTNNAPKLTSPSVTSFKLHPNYPNPFNPLTRIAFDSPIEGRVTLTIYDMLGREVARLFDGEITAGSHSYSWDASNVSSGMYFCHYIVTDTYGKRKHSEIQKLILIR